MNDSTQASAAHVVARAISQIQLDHREVSDGCWICQQQLWISVFFDEPGHDAEKERGTERLSNIGKLLYAHSNEEEKGLYRRYYNGLGVAFNPSSDVRAQTAQDQAQTEADGLLQEKEKELLYKRGAWKDLLNPRNWGADLLGLAAKVGLEAWDGLRDKPLVSQVTLSGVDTRINTALSALDETVDSIAKAQCPFAESVRPGTPQDVVGGLSQQHQGRSHALARACRWPHHRAGVRSKTANSLGQRTC